MEQLISCCGLNCGACEARIATINNDDALRAETAEKWKVQYNAEITAGMINCTGCRMPGVKLGHVSECKIRKCADDRGFVTCAECGDLETCELVSQVHKFVPEALENLRKLRN